MAEPAFRGTLLLLQNKTRRDPESYKDEFLAQFEHFKASSATVAVQRVASPQFMAVLNYLCHVCHHFPEEGQMIAGIVVELLRASKGNSLPSELRTALVKAMMLLRSKAIISTEVTFPVLFSLLQERDKALRHAILTHIVGDIRKINLGGKSGAQVNRVAQSYLFSVMAEDDPIQARCAEMVMIDLYRRRVWCDERTVEVMTRACFSKHTSIIRTALRFFLLQMPKLSSMNDDDDDEELDPGRSISKLKQKLKIVKKTSKRDRVLKRNVRDIKRKYNKEEKEAEAFAKQHVDPIRLLRDPQQFVERLLAKLQKTSERFEVRILYLNVIARTVSEHEIVHLPLYTFLERYMEPSQLHSTQLLALSSMCIHKMVPPDSVEPLVKAIANHFVTDRSTPDAITVGLNTIREICKRQPLAMNEDLLKDLVEYKNQRGEKGVIMASRALLQLYREVYPELLPVKLRGSVAGPADTSARPIYGAEKVYTDIPGLELLFHESNSDSDDQSGSSSTTDTDSSSGEWITDTDEEADPDDVDGSFVSVSDDLSQASDDDDDDDDDSRCPQLVPAALSPPTKRRRAEEEYSETDSDIASSGDVKSSGSLEEMEDDSSDNDTESQEENNNEVHHKSYGGDVSNKKNEWFESLNSHAEPPSRAASTTSSKKEGLSTTRILTDEDFQRIRQLQGQNGAHRSLRGKKKEKEAKAKKRSDLIYFISSDISAQDLEHFTERKRESDKQEKLERAQELRKASSKFEIGKKKKSKLNSTHTEHSKRGKLFQMTKRSQRVATKLKSSVGDRANRAKEMKKKDIKFRIKRGWKA